MLHDTHCHFDAYDDPSAELAAVSKAGIRATWVTMSPASFAAAQRVAAGMNGIDIAAGLHPLEAAAREDELPTLLEQIAETRWVGEVGLDFVTEDEENREAQRRVFRAVLERCDQLGGRVITIHSRRSAGQVLDLLGDGHPGAVLHWFSGDETALERALAQRRWYSVNTAMVRSSTRRTMVAQMPADRVLLESDGPYIEIDGRPARPRDGELVVQHLASLWGRSREDVRGQLSENYAELTGG